MFNYIELIKMYEAGLMSKEEVNTMIGIINMGSDTTFEKEVK